MFFGFISGEGREFLSIVTSILIVMYLSFICNPLLYTLPSFAFHSLTLALFHFSSVVCLFSYSHLPSISPFLFIILSLPNVFSLCLLSLICTLLSLPLSFFVLHSSFFIVLSLLSLPISFLSFSFSFPPQLPLPPFFFIFHFSSVPLSSSFLLLNISSFSFSP